MVQRATDAAVLGVFSMLYSCAVLLLSRRTRRLGGATASQAQSTFLRAHSLDIAASE